MKKVAIIYHYLALYRLPIFHELMKSKDIEYTILSGTTSETDIKKIDESYANLQLEDGGLRWRQIKNIWIFKKKLLWQKQIIKIAFSNEFDAFIFLGSPYFITTWIAAIIARLKGKNIYFWMHGVYSDKLSLADYFKLFVFYKLVNGYFLYGNRAAKILMKFKINSKENIHVIYNSLNYSKSLEFRKKISEGDIIEFRKNTFLDPSLPTIIFIGRLNSVKKLNLLFHAQRSLLEKHKSCLFNTIIVGDGDQLDSLKALSKSNKLDRNVVFKGAIYDENEISKLLTYSDLCVCPGEVGLTAIHSLSYGTPVISHNKLSIQMPEVEAISMKISGDLYEYDNVADLAIKIEEWILANPIKDEAISRNCYKVIDKYYNPVYQAQVFNSTLNSKLW